MGMLAIPRHDRPSIQQENRGPHFAPWLLLFHPCAEIRQAMRTQRSSFCCTVQFENVGGFDFMAVVKQQGNKLTVQHTQLASLKNCERIDRTNLLVQSFRGGKISPLLLDLTMPRLALCHTELVPRIATLREAVFCSTDTESPRTTPYDWETCTVKQQLKKNLWRSVREQRITLAVEATGGELAVRNWASSWT